MTKLENLKKQQKSLKFLDAVFLRLNIGYKKDKF